MKTFLSALLSVSLGFAISRFLPAGPGGDGVTAVSLPASAGDAKTPRSAPASGRPAGDAARPGDGGKDWESAAKAWSEEDPAGFCEWLVRRGVPPDAKVLLDLFSGWVKKDPYAAFTAALRLPPDFQLRGRVPGLKDSMLRAALDQPGGIKAVWPWIPDALEGQHGFVLPSADWLQSAPPAQWAAFLAAYTRNSSYESGMTWQLGAHWAATDLPAAMEWMRSQPPKLRRDAFRGIMETWSKQDPAAALDYLAAEGTSAERENINMALTAMADKNPRAALEWWEEHLGVSTNGVLVEIYGVWCDRDPAQALEYTRGIGDPALRRQSLASWSERAPAARVLEEFQNTSGEADRMAVLQGLSLNHDLSSSLAEIRQIMEREPAGRITSTLAGRVSDSYAGQDPEAALVWVGTLPENVQASSLSRVFNRWGDKTAAARAVEQLPDSEFKTRALSAWEKQRTAAAN